MMGLNFQKLKNNPIYIFLFLFALVSIYIVICYDGTGDAGDSIQHYQFAKYAPLHPELFFNHWAKPVYTLLASPFAQFGFIGIKVFNALVSLLTLFFTFRAVKKLGLKNALFAPVILLFSPLFFVFTFSGLTEPLFALFLSIGLFLILSKKLVLSSIIISFLPFIRSEGLLLIGIFGFYLLLKKEWRTIPYLLLGHLAYSIAGYFVFKDLFWVFNEIPYAHLSSTYGEGELNHFVKQLLYVVGVPIYLLFWVGTLALILKSIKRRINVELQILVFLGFFAFLIAHSLFWYLGIFNSMGLKRVLIGVLPLLSIISLIGYNFLTEEALKTKKRTKYFVQGLLILYALVFPFTSNPAAINWQSELSLNEDQKLIHKVALFLENESDKNPRYVFAHPYLSEALEIDPFDEQKKLELTQEGLQYINTGDIVIWENWFAVVENGVTQSMLDSNNDLIKMHSASVRARGREIVYVIYKRK
ncbi:MAG: hypothetical protein ACI9XP_001370 [Lentimonas sp.]|jgi:hypothetical protein